MSTCTDFSFPLLQYSHWSFCFLPPFFLSPSLLRPRKSFSGKKGENGKGIEDRRRERERGKGEWTGTKDRTKKGRWPVRLGPRDLRFFPLFPFFSLSLLPSLPLSSIPVIFPFDSFRSTDHSSSNSQFLHFPHSLFFPFIFVLRLSSIFVASKLMYI